MPQLDDILEQRKEKKFTKKSYRPWDLSGSAPLHLDIDATIPTETSAPEEIANPINNELDNRIATDKDSYKITNSKPLDNISISNRQQPDNKEITIREQLDNEIGAKSLKQIIIKLSGLQKNFLDFIFDICLARDTLETGPIETALISKHLNTTYGSLKTTLHRLVEKNIIHRLQGRTARGGYINIGISEELKRTYQETRIMFLKGKSALDIISNYRYQLDNNSPTNSSSNINTTTKTPMLLSNGWESIDLEPLKHIGFSETQLQQLQNKNKLEVVQESIYHFAYGLEYNQKVKNYSDPLNVLMGVLRKGQAWFEKDYKSPQEIAMEELLQRKKLQRERENKLREDLIKEEFEEWYTNMRDDEKQELLNSFDLSLIRNLKSKDLIIKSKFFEFFKENVLKHTNKI